MWTAKLQDNYSDFEQWEEFSDTYGLSERLEFNSAIEAWNKNPMIQGSTNPSDFKVVPDSVTHDEFTTAYLYAALWSSTDETNPEQGGEPLDKNYGIEDIDPETLAEMLADCKRFQEENAELITDDNLVKYGVDSVDAQAGYDFWLTRCGHGSGFWDGDWVEPAATTLTDMAAAYGEYDLIASGKGGQVSKM